MRRLLIVCAIVLAVAYAVGIPLFLGRDDDALPQEADAIVALSGSDRPLPEARALFASGLAPTLVVSSDKDPRETTRSTLCHKPPRGVVCITPGQLSTFDEARLVNDIATKRHWRSIVLVGPQYAAYRAGRVFDRCVDAHVTSYGVDEPWWRNAIAVPLEWVKLAVSETVRRRC